MKIIEAINQIDSQKPNTYSYNEKLSWLSRLDFMVKRLIIDTHEGGDDVEFTGYDASTDQNTEMLVPAPFDEMYISWFMTQRKACGTRKIICKQRSCVPAGTSCTALCRMGRSSQSLAAGKHMKKMLHGWRKPALSMRHFPNGNTCSG